MRPARVRASASIGARAEAGVRASGASESWQKRRSAGVQKPAGEIAVAERDRAAAGQLERDRAAHRVARDVRALEA